MNWLTSRCAPLAAFVALSLTSCDTGTALNVDLPDTATTNTQYQDYDVTSGTVRLAPVQTQKTNHFLVGRLADNVAGTTTAKAFSNVVDFSTLFPTILDSLPSKFNDPKLFSGSPVLDSTVLIMGFDQVYGSSTTPARFDVFQLAAPLDERQVYNASSSENGLVKLGENLSSRLDRTKVQVVKAADNSVTPNIPAVTTVVPDQTVRLVLQRRVANGSQPAITLPFARDLFSQMLLPGFSQSKMIAQVKGLAIAPNSTYNSGIVSFGAPNTSRMVLYFHSNSAWKVINNKLPADTLKRSYSVHIGPAFSSAGLSSSSDPRYYTQITNDLPPALAALSSNAGFVPSTSLGGTSYVQEGTGLGTRVSFTGIDVLTKAAAAGGLTINRAELRVPVKPYTNVLFPNPTALYAVEVGSANEVLQRIINYVPTDRVVQGDGASQTGSLVPALATLTAISAAQTYYTLPITSYLQAYLNNQLGGNPSGGLLLVPNIRSTNTLTLNRAVLDASNIKLRVYYSKR